jgi:hypothetical protein
MSDGWIKIRWNGVVELLRRGWRWERKQQELLLVAPSGARWRFKLSGGAYVRRDSFKRGLDYQI